MLRWPNGRRNDVAVESIWERRQRNPLFILGLCLCGIIAGAFSGAAYDRVVRPGRGAERLHVAFSQSARAEFETPAATECKCLEKPISGIVQPSCPPTPVWKLPPNSDDALATLISHDSKWTSTRNSSARVCMLVRTFEGHRNKLIALLLSVLLWEHPHMTITLLDTGMESPFTELPTIAASMSSIAGRPDAVRVSRWRSTEARALFPQLGSMEDHGYVATDLALEDMLDERRTARDGGKTESELPCSNVIITNGDNMYSYSYLAATLEAVANGAELVSTHWVSHYDMKKEWILGWGEIQNGHCGPWRPGRDGEVAASPSFIRGCVDLGVVTFRASLIEESSYRFVISSLRQLKTESEVRGAFTAMETMFYADGNFFQKLYKYLQDHGRVANAVMIRRALFLHQ